MIFDGEANSAGVAEATAALESALGDGLQLLYREVIISERPAQQFMFFLGTFFLNLVPT